MASFTSTSHSDASLEVTLIQAISWLTESLSRYYSQTVIEVLQQSLYVNLKAQYAPTWVPSDPLHGFGRRCLSLSPLTNPPRPIYSACQAAGIEWSRWIALLGGFEFDLFIDPARVSIRPGGPGNGSGFTTIWQGAGGEQLQREPISENEVQAELRAQARARALAVQIQNPSKTAARECLIDDHEEDEIFAMIADEVAKPTWVTPVRTEFPSGLVPPRSTNSSPVSVASSTSMHSRSSSRSSNWSYGVDSCGSTSTISQSSPSDEKASHKLSRRERARQARVFVDMTKTVVTNYDGGKTTVLTGGVMLGGKATGGGAGHQRTESSSSANWRAARV